MEIVYKIANIINGKFYINKHTLKYLGSGVLLRKEVEKYGEENFKKEVAKHCKTREPKQIKYKEYCK